VKRSYQKLLLKMAAIQLKQVQNGETSMRDYEVFCENVFGGKDPAHEGCKALDEAIVKDKEVVNEVAHSDVNVSRAAGEAGQYSEKQKAPMLAACQNSGAQRLAAQVRQSGSSVTLASDRAAPRMAAAQQKGTAQQVAAVSQCAQVNGAEKKKSRLGRPRGSRGYGKRLWRRRQMEKQASRNTRCSVSAAISSKSASMSSDISAKQNEQLCQDRDAEHRMDPVQDRMGNDYAREVQKSEAGSREVERVKEKKEVDRLKIKDKEQELCERRHVWDREKQQIRKDNGEAVFKTMGTELNKLNSVAWAKYWEENSRPDVAEDVETQARCDKEEQTMNMQARNIENYDRQKMVVGHTGWWLVLWLLMVVLLGSGAMQSAISVMLMRQLWIAVANNVSCNAESLAAMQQKGQQRKPNARTLAKRWAGVTARLQNVNSTRERGELSVGWKGVAMALAGVAKELREDLKWINKGSALDGSLDEVMKSEMQAKPKEDVQAVETPRVVTQRKRATKLKGHDCYA